jgi:methylmalonyl-CoA mutase
MTERDELNPFGAASYEDWRRLAERDLAGAPFERRLVKRVAGLEVQPLYTARDQPPDIGSLPGQPPYRRGRRPPSATAGQWGIAQDIAQHDPEAAVRAARDAIDGGATWLALRLEDPSPVLDAVPLASVGVLLSGGHGSLPATRMLQHVKQKALATTPLSGCLGLDPLGSWAARGVLPCSLEAALAEAAEIARRAHGEAPGLRALLVNASVYHGAGADAARELGIALATGVAYLRVLTDAGLPIGVASSQLAFELSLGTDFFLEIAKLRAARLAWSRLVAAAGGDATAQSLFCIARGSRRALTRRDAWVNLLRGTSESFAAVVGGADVVITPSLTDALGESLALGARLARNTQHVLAHEAQLTRVLDPGGGSFYIEALTDALARKAWEHLQALERAGGVARSLQDGVLQRELLAALEAERLAVETRRVPIIGVSQYARVDEQEPAYQPVDDEAATPRVSLPPDAAPSAPAVCTPLVLERLAEPFEDLRAHADELTRQQGKRPRVFLANLGPVSSHEPRAAFAQGYFAAGGFATSSNDGFETPEAAAAAFAGSGADIAVICSSDAIYAELAAKTARALSQQHPRAIVLAGNPGANEAAYRAAGISHFIFFGDNAVQSLSALLDRVGGG